MRNGKKKICKETVATWNVRSLLNSGKLDNLIQEIREQGILITELSEIFSRSACESSS